MNDEADRDNENVPTATEFGSIAISCDHSAAFRNETLHHLVTREMGISLWPEMLHTARDQGQMKRYGAALSQSYKERPEPETTGVDPAVVSGESLRRAVISFFSGGAWSQ